MMFKSLNLIIKKEKKNFLQNMDKVLGIETATKEFILNRISQISPNAVSIKYNLAQGVLLISTQSKIIAQEINLIRSETHDFLKNRCPGLTRIIVR